jgi:hypothetical protein
VPLAEVSLFLGRFLTVAGGVAYAATSIWSLAAARATVPGSSDVAAREHREHVLDGLDRAKWIAAGAVLIGVLLEVQEMGSSLPLRRVARAVLLFVAVASHVYSVMVVKPRIRYYTERMREGEAAGNPWRTNVERQTVRNEMVSLFGLVLAVAALFMG